MTIVSWKWMFLPRLCSERKSSILPEYFTMLSCLSKSRCTYSLTFAAWPCHNQSPTAEIHHRLKSHTQAMFFLLSFPWPCYIVKAHILLLYYYHCYVDTFTGYYRDSLWNHFFGSWHLGNWRIFISLGPQISSKAAILSPRRSIRSGTCSRFFRRLVKVIFWYITWGMHK